MKTTRTITADIHCPPSDAFALLTDLNGLARWLDSSGTYKGTEDVADEPLRVGTTYTDRIPGARVYGEVLELQRDELVVFQQATRPAWLAITIRYEIAPTSSGTRVVRTGDIETHGLLSLVHPVVVDVTQKENARTMRKLKEYLENRAR